ncbi:hypothetical protein CAEBREN_10298 [Caenorhabditis brenneri]|uniref:Uncharacterized protein n=1 Tax=Caenorhabditis brenneri TaxID=135651 RepID=G0NTM4_CAEBE|nr:hypothetical protein CAEBREN_10298 [Caenorhabditis brenneri]
MKTILLLLALTTAAYSVGLGLVIPVGTKDFELPIHAYEPKAFTRVLKNGEKQTWNLSGPNKGTWVDAKGKKIPSSNFVFVAPDTLKIKKVTKEDAGAYDYIPSRVVEDFSSPPGVHVDPGVPSGVDLDVAA